MQFSLYEAATLLELGLYAPRGVLLHGPTGCGKTLLASALASHVSAQNNTSMGSVSFISVQCSSFISKIVGESERMIANIFKNLRASAPCILFLDQVHKSLRSCLIVARLKL